MSNELALDRARRATERLTGRVESAGAPQAAKKALAPWTPLEEVSIPWTTEQVCAEIAQGRSIRDIAAQMGVHPGTLALWLNEEERREQYLSAMIVHAQMRATEIVNISDDTEIDPAHKKIMVESRWRLAQTLVADIYGQKQQPQKQVSVALVTFREEPTGAVITVPMEEITVQTSNADTRQDAQSAAQGTPDAKEG